LTQYFGSTKKQNASCEAKFLLALPDGPIAESLAQWHRKLDIAIPNWLHQ